MYKSNLSDTELNLDAEKIHAIIHAINERQHAYLRLDDTDEQGHVIILGADVNEGCILLSDIYPSSVLANKTNINAQTFWLRIKSGTQYLTLKLVNVELENKLLSARIAETFWSKNKRWNSRVKFPDRQGPNAIVAREFAPNAKGYVRDISERGAALDFWGTEFKNAFRKGQSLSPHFIFNSCFELNMQAQISSVCFFRHPCCHTRVRVKFHALSEVKRSQLHNFVNSQFGHRYSNVG